MKRHRQVPHNNRRAIAVEPPAPAEGLSPFAQKLDRAFREIFEGKVTVRHVEVPEPEEYPPSRIVKLRQELGVSQPVFAKLMGASTVLVQSWEQGQRVPSPMARRLLDEIRRDPRRWAQTLRPVA